MVHLAHPVFPALKRALHDHQLAVFHVAHGLPDGSLVFLGDLLHPRSFVFCQGDECVVVSQDLGEASHAAQLVGQLVYLRRHADQVAGEQALLRRNPGAIGSPFAGQVLRDEAFVQHVFGCLFDVVARRLLAAGLNLHDVPHGPPLSAWLPEFWDGCASPPWCGR